MTDNPTTAPDVAALRKLRDAAKCGDAEYLFHHRSEYLPLMTAALDSHDALTAQVAALTAERDALREWLDEFEAETDALPFQHENKRKGQCTYNWHKPICRELRALLAAPGEEAQHD